MHGRGILWADVKDADGENTVAVWVIKVQSVRVTTEEFVLERRKFSLVLPAAGVLVQVGAGEALVATSSSQNLPGLLSTADLDPGEACRDEQKREKLHSYPLPVLL